MCLINSGLSYKNLVALLKFVPLYLGTNWNRYEHRQVCFRTDCAVSSETLL